MKTRLLIFMAAVAILVFSAPASADIGLADWCVNNNGSVGAGSNQPSNSCNGGTLAADPNVHMAAFDTTLEPGANAAATSAQSITVSFGAGLQTIGVFMNYDIDFKSFGSFGDYGTVVGAPPAGFSYEMDNEFTSSIFSDFAAGALTDANNVGFAACNALYPPQYCDVSWALQDTFVAASPGSITFTVSTAKPAAGFYLEQTSGLSCQASGGVGPTCANLYLSVGGAAPPPPIPEPSTWLLLSTVIGFLFLARKKLLARAT